MNLGFIEHHNVWLKCEKVLNDVKQEIKTEARELSRKRSVETAWETARDLVRDKGWKTLKGRLKKEFQDDNDPLNIRRRDVADVFYGAQTVKFKVQFKHEIQSILEGKEVPEKEGVSSDSDVDEEITEENSDVE